MTFCSLRLNTRFLSLLVTLGLGGVLVGCGLLDTPGPSATFGKIQSPADSQNSLPDLIIQSIFISGDSALDCPAPDQSFHTRVKILNKGKSPAGAFIVRLNMDQQLIAKGLQPGEFVEVVFPDEAPSVKALVDVTSLVAEQDESNNQIIQKLAYPTPAPECLATATPEIVQVDSALVFSGHAAKVWDVKFSPGQKTLASGSVDDTVKLWALDPPGLISTMEGHPFPVLKIAYTPDGSVLYTGSTDGIIRAWDTTTGEMKQALESHTGWITALTVSGDGKWLASSAEDSTIRLWRLPAADLAQIIDEGLTGINCITFTPDSSAVAWGEVDGTIRIRTISGEWLYTLKSSSHPVTSLVFSADSRMLITGYSDGIIRVWNAKEGTPRQTIFAHTGAVTDLAVSRNGLWLVSSSNDQTLRLWKYEDEEFRMLPTRIFAGHTGPVTSVDFSEELSLIASGSEDGSIRIWNIP